LALLDITERKRAEDALRERPGKGATFIINLPVEPI
jgi:hypothetical protein